MRFTLFTAILSTSLVAGCTRGESRGTEPRVRDEHARGEPVADDTHVPASPRIEVAECTIGSNVGGRGGGLVLGEDGWLSVGGRRFEHFDPSGAVTDAAGQTVLTLRANGDVANAFGDVVYRATPDGAFVEAPPPPARFEDRRLVQDGVRIAEVTSGFDEASRRAAALAVVLAGMREDLLYLDQDPEVDASPIALPEQPVTIDTYPDGELVDQTLVLSPEGELTGLSMPLIIHADGRITQDSPDGHLLAWIDAEGVLHAAGGAPLGRSFTEDGAVRGVGGERLSADDQGHVPYAGGPLRLTASPATPACKRIALLHAIVATMAARDVKRAYRLRAATIGAVGALAGGETSLAGREIVEPRRREALAEQVTALAEMDEDAIERERRTARLDELPGDLARGLGFDPRLCVAVELREGRVVACSRTAWPARPTIVDLDGFGAGGGSSHP